MSLEKKKPNNREMWSDQEYCQLLLYSYQGTDRKTLQLILSRTTAKIFSKIQKHIILTENVIRGLNATTLDSEQHRVQIH